ncbi:MSMEG_1061 family FMN-dependent PPOX-type flavoprotein [Microbacterium indicum]|uniref:MSMEG_1061 family FMN-dependent PPOX-type flavoprotein n=1 Tax=Microbacterium indicum TaxID=358100 RepID=UPI0004212B09|nr:MSMEG_1061 family FMN-dependent PPOX-type flavoprotein [Microbacterium indicum]
MRDGWRVVDDVAALEAVVGVPLPSTRDKVRAELADDDVAWLAATPFCFVATSDAAGNCDVSPKGDPAGSLVHVIDARTVAIAERPGNRRVDGYRNILQNPHVGLDCVIPGRGDTLRINGRATLVSDAPFFDDLAVTGRRPILALVVDIDEVFHHCSKAFLRSQLWKPETWDPERTVPRRAVLASRLDRRDASLEELDAYYGDSYGRKLY